jgi:S-adenosylmethionine:tRNA ribosyltransferase-isomerase
LLARTRPPGRKSLSARSSVSVFLGAIELKTEVIERGEYGDRLLRFEPVDDFYAALERIGHVPLPPYIHRDDAEADRERYQTVYSCDRGSVAAPTAGLHFTPKILDELASRGVEVARVTLHVGLGTFAPLRVERVADVHLHRTHALCTATEINRALQLSSAINTRSACACLCAKLSAFWFTPTYRFASI